MTRGEKFKLLWNGLAKGKSGNHSLLSRKITVKKMSVPIGAVLAKLFFLAFFVVEAFTFAYISRHEKKGNLCLCQEKPFLCMSLQSAYYASRKGIPPISA